MKDSRGEIGALIPAVVLIGFLCFSHVPARVAGYLGAVVVLLALTALGIRVGKLLSWCQGRGGLLDRIREDEDEQDRLEEAQNNLHHQVEDYDKFRRRVR